MLPAGAITEETVGKLGGLMQADDCIIDGGNSFYQDDVRRARDLDAKGIHYVDVGTSGGVWGLERGYCMMIGGHKAAVDRLDPIFRTLAPGLGDIPRTVGRDGRDPRAELGYIHAGPSGAGHFVKMIHNGIEYGLMQAYAEGFDILKHANSEQVPEERRFDLNLGDIARCGGAAAWSRPGCSTSPRRRSRATRRSRTSLATSRIPARDAGPSTPPSRRRCRPPFCRARSTAASAPARMRATPTSCSRPCERGSADIRSRRAGGRRRDRASPRTN